MEAECSSETSVNFHWTIRRYVSEDTTTNKHRSKKLKTRKVVYGLKFMVGCVFK
jgi:hypothetical protein